MASSIRTMPDTPICSAPIEGAPNAWHTLFVCLPAVHLYGDRGTYDLCYRLHPGGLYVPFRRFYTPATFHCPCPRVMPCRSVPSQGACMVFFPLAFRHDEGPPPLPRVLLEHDNGGKLNLRLPRLYTVCFACAMCASCFAGCTCVCCGVTRVCAGAMVCAPQSITCWVHHTWVVASARSGI